jgi:hypothetical protein
MGGHGESQGYSGSRLHCSAKITTRTLAGGTGLVTLRISDDRGPGLQRRTASLSRTSTFYASRISFEL